MVLAHKASLLQAVVVVPESVGVHLHAVLFNGAPRVEGFIGLSRRPVEEAQRRFVRPGPANYNMKQGGVGSAREVGAHAKCKGLSNTEMVPAMLTVAVPGEADPKVVIFGVVEVPDKLHLCSAVKRRQLSSSYRQTVVSRIWPGKALLTVDHEVTVAAVGHPERVTHPVTGGRCWWWTLWKIKYAKFTCFVFFIGAIRVRSGYLS